MKKNFGWKIQTDTAAVILLIPPEGTLGMAAELVQQATSGPEANLKTSRVDASDEGHGSASSTLAITTSAHPLRTKQFRTPPGTGRLSAG